MKAMNVEAVNSPSPEITRLPPYNKIPVTTKTPSVSETGEVSSCRNTIFNKAWRYFWFPSPNRSSIIFSALNALTTRIAPKISSSKLIKPLKCCWTSPAARLKRRVIVAMTPPESGKMSKENKVNFTDMLARKTKNRINVKISLKVAVKARPILFSTSWTSVVNRDIKFPFFCSVK